MSAALDRFERDRAFLGAYRALPSAERSALCRLLLKAPAGEPIRDRFARFHIEIGFEPEAAYAEADAILSGSSGRPN